MKAARSWRWVLLAALLPFSARSEAPAPAADPYPAKLKALGTEHASALLKLAKAARAESPGRARILAKRALEADPGNPEAGKLLGELDKAKPAKTGKPAREFLKKQGEFLSAYHAAMDKVATRHLELALWCRANGHETEAGGLLESAVRLSPDHAKARAARGEARPPGYRWMPKEDAEQVAKGLRRCKDGWHTKEEIRKMLEEEGQALMAQRKLKGHALAVSEHFAVSTDAGARYAADFGRTCDEFHRAVHAAFLGGLPADFRPIHALVFSTNAAFVAYGGPGMKDNMGFYSGADNTLHYFLEGNGIGTAYHEVFHGILRHDLSWPLEMFFNEGFASYFEICSPGGAKPTFGPPQSLHQVNVKNSVVKYKDNYTLAQILGTDDALFHKDQSLGYGSGVMCIHFLKEAGVLERVYALYRERGRGTLPACLEDAFVLPIEEIDPAFAAFCSL